MKQKILFIDRDGTIIVEPPTDFQVDSFEKLAFLPGAITYLRKISEELDFAFVMVTNQDGLGTKSFPESTFWGPHEKMLEILAGEQINFRAVHIDRSFPADNLPTRKPGTAMLTEYTTPDYDLASSYVIGDRLSDVALAKNLGTKAIFIGKETAPDAALSTSRWEDIYHFLKFPDRTAHVRRQTKETDIEICLNLDQKKTAPISTGIGFFDHMLEQIARHAGCTLKIKTTGDLHIDTHHTIEDTALALGEAFSKALGNKKGIERYAFLLPMDESLAQVALDFSGRSQLVWEADFTREKIGEMPTEMFAHFFKSFSDTANCTLHISAKGKNEHHKIEAIFKAFAKTVGQAIRRTSTQIPSTKGVL